MKNQALVPIKDKQLLMNGRAIDVNGQFLFSANARRLNWYLDQELAELVSFDPFVIKLLIKTHGTGPGLDMAYDVKCVVCGSETDLTKHHVVPLEFRRHMPETHADAYDVLFVCTSCHEIFNPMEINYKLSIYQKRNIVRKQLPPQYSDLHKAKCWIRALIKHGNKMPTDCREALRNKIKSILPDATFDSEMIEKINQEQLELKTKYRRLAAKTLVGGMNKQERIELIRNWRKFFITCMQPKFLPDWYKIERDEEFREKTKPDAAELARYELKGNRSWPRKRNHV